MSRTWRKWIRGLIAAGINGAVGVTAVMAFDPLTFNFQEGMPKALSIMGVMAFMGILTYLKDHALPEDDPISVVPVPQLAAADAKRLVDLEAELARLRRLQTAYAGERDE